MIISKVFKSGPSLAVIIPATLAKELKIKAGDYVKFTNKANEKATLEKVAD